MAKNTELYFLLEKLYAVMCGNIASDIKLLLP